MLPACCLVAMIFTASRTVAVLLLMAAHFASALDVGGAGLVILDLFPEHAGALKGVSCLWGNAPGLAAPIVTGMLLDMGGCGVAATPGSASSGSAEASVGEACGQAWDIVLAISAALYAIGVLVFLVGVTAEHRYR